MAPPPAAAGVFAPDANRLATVLLTDQALDPSKPDCGIQAAIDALPPSGGALVLPKGTFLLRRFLELHSHTVLAGQGPDKESLERLVDSLGLRDRVHFLGFVQDVRPLLCAATALVLTSVREGLARSVMEGLSLGVPAIASTARGNGELLGDDAGILFTVGDVRGLADAMDWMIDQPEERRAMGLRGRNRMVERYDLQPIIEMHEELYRGVLLERSRRTL
jgi:glycosyltransferase involved in cell wall biosynthesis